VLEWLLLLLPFEICLFTFDSSMTDQDFIQIALELAAQGTALVSPNPLVGTVVVREGAIVGRGFHRYDELKHAEVWALEDAGELARGATVYMNLEPCSHQGDGKRTPPCTKALIEAGVKRVVASMVDPNPRVNGAGFALLRDAGIEVMTGAGEDEAQRLNEKYVKFVTSGLPYVHLKTACSLDGRIATRTGESKWITGEQARSASQVLRHESDAILVGVGTVLADDPLLTDRTGRPRRKPLQRVILDPRLRIPLDSQLVRTAREFPLIVFTRQEKQSSVRARDLEVLGVTVNCIEPVSSGFDLTEVLRSLAETQVTSLIVEGGATTAGLFIEQRLVDKVTFYIAPKIIGGREAFPAIGSLGVDHLSEVMELEGLNVTSRGRDLEITGYPKVK